MIEPPSFGITTLSRRRVLAMGGTGLLALLVGCGAARPWHRLSLWTLALRPWFDDYMAERIAVFEAAYPPFRIDWVDVPYDAIDRKLIAAAAAGMAPDVVNLADLNFARFASLGAFRDLTPDLPIDADATYLAGALPMCRIGGRLLGVPWYVNPQALVVNESLLKEGGLSPATLPRSWGGLVEAAPAFRAATGKYLFSQSLGEESQLPIMMLAEGIALFMADEDGHVVSNFDQPAVRDYLSCFANLYASGNLPSDAATRGHAHLTDLYQDGSVAAINTGPNFLGRIRDVSPSIFASTSVLPGVVGDLNRIHMPVMTISVTSQSRHPEAAAALAAFITGHESQLALCKRSAVMPSTIRTLTDPMFTASTDANADADERRLASARAVAARTLPGAVAFTPSIPAWPDLRRAFEDEFKRVLLSGRTVGDAATRIDIAWDRMLKASERVTMSAVPAPEPYPS